MSVTEEKKNALPRAVKAEAVGVDSKEVQAFIDDCRENSIEVHSIMVLRHGQVASEAYKYPFGPDKKHMVYSVSKSFTSTAIGLAIHEGYLSLETKFLDIFPEFRPLKFDPYLEKLNVHHLLCMQSGKSVSPMVDRTADHWIEDFVESPWAFEPGTEWQYISENMYILCAMIHRQTGMSVMEFLTPRLFEPLGIEDPFWETCPSGIETGGWGLMIKLEDLAKFSLCYQQKGMFNGKQVIPQEWVELASSAIADNSSKNTDLDNDKGYGYCFWRCGGYANAFRSDGMFSQYGIVFEDIDAVVAVNSGNADQQVVLDAIWRHFPKAFIDDDPDAETVIPEFEPYKAIEPGDRNTEIERKLEGRRITFNKAHVINIAGLPVSVIPLVATFMEKDRAGNINNIDFLFLEDELIFSWSEGDERNSIHVGMDGEYRWDSIVLGGIRYTTASCAAWTGDNVLEVRIRPIETIAERILKFNFKENNKVAMEPSTFPSSSAIVDRVKYAVKNVLSSDLLANIAERALPAVGTFMDPTHHGVIR